MTAGTILVINAGSSSVKYRLFDLDDLSIVAGDKITSIGEPHAETSTHEEAFRKILSAISDHHIVAAAHRVVHGGSDFRSACRVDNIILDALDALSVYAPLHQPHNLNAIRILAALKPDMPQFVDFDTAFHVGHDPLFDSYALPEDLRNRGLKKYGFHGLSYQSICRSLEQNHPDLYRGKYVIAHLGNGASLCAVQNGQSIDTTMGLTALDGLPMGTRSGSVDPGLILHLIREDGYSAEDLSDILYHHSGLLGLSGISNDVKTLEQSDSADAAFALDYFCHKASQNVAMMAASLGGMDALVFTGGIGENSQRIRTGILSRLEFLPDFRSLIISTREELTIAQNIRPLINTDL